MPTLRKAKSGSIYENVFSSSLGEEWNILPDSSHANVANRSLYLTNDNAARVRALLDIPHGSFILYVKFNYTIDPDIEKSAGLTLFKGEFDFLELQKYNNPDMGNQPNYTYLKAVRIIDDEYEFYGSLNGTDWDLVGTDSFPGPAKMGVYIKGSGESRISYIAACRSEKVYLYGIPAGIRVTLHEYNRVLDEYEIYYQEESTDIREIVEFYLRPDFEGYFDLEYYKSLEIGGTFWAGWVSIGSTLLDIINGGDEFVYDLMLKVEMCNSETQDFEEIEIGEPINLGVFEDTYIKKRIKVTNTDNQIIENLQISVLQKAFNRGWRMVDIAQSEDDAIFGVYSDVVITNDIQPGNSIEFTIKIERDENYLYDSQGEFLIDLKGW